MATHSSVLAWRIPGTGERGGLPSMGLHRVGHDWSDLAAVAGSSGHGIYVHNYHLAKKKKEKQKTRNPIFLGVKAELLHCLSNSDLPKYWPVVRESWNDCGRVRERTSGTICSLFLSALGLKYLESPCPTAIVEETPWHAGLLTVFSENMGQHPFSPLWRFHAGTWGQLWRRACGSEQSPGGGSLMHIPWATWNVLGLPYAPATARDRLACDLTDFHSNKLGRALLNAPAVLSLPLQVMMVHEAGLVPKQVKFISPRELKYTVVNLWPCNVAGQWTQLPPSSFGCIALKCNQMPSG